MAKAAVSFIALVAITKEVGEEILDSFSLVLNQF